MWDAFYVRLIFLLSNILSRYLFQCYIFSTIHACSRSILKSIPVISRRLSRRSASGSQVRARARSRRSSCPYWKVSSISWRNSHYSSRTRDPLRGEYRANLLSPSPRSVVSSGELTPAFRLSTDWPGISVPWPDAWHWYRYWSRATLRHWCDRIQFLFIWYLSKLWSRNFLLDWIFDTLSP